MKSVLIELQKKGLVSDFEIDSLVEEYQRRGISLHRMLLQHKGINIDNLQDAWSEIFKTPRLNKLDHHTPSPEYLSHFSMEFSRSHGCMVFEQSENDDLHLALLHPLELELRDHISLKLNKPLVPVLVSEENLNRYLEQSFDMSNNVQQDLPGFDEESLKNLSQEIEESEDLLDMANKAPVVKLINTFLFQALKQRASDIHIQPYEEQLKVRFRIDGILQEVLQLPKSIQNAVLSRIKVMGKMDIAEKRLPQDGTTSFVAAGRDVDVRISSLPSVFGERIVMRLQDKSTGVKKISEIGLGKEDNESINKLLSMSHGIILVTGPTGAGKTTTLYAMLDQLNDPNKNIITLEDPVELMLPGISQVQVANKKGLDFSAGLRSIVRQDPDVIMVGEIRDLETARISIQSALTGHLVFSTLHTNDSISALTRLMDIGVEAALINSALLSVIAQRLVRTICENCKTTFKPTLAELKMWDMDRDTFKGHTIHRGKGCEQCSNTGYQGRVAIYEILMMDKAIKNAVSKGASNREIQELAIKQKFKTLRNDGIQKIIAGLTTPEEIFRITQLKDF
jgi:general secretion pathway protein E